MGILELRYRLFSEKRGGKIPSSRPSLATYRLGFSVRKPVLHFHCRSRDSSYTRIFLARRGNSWALSYISIKAYFIPISEIS